MQMHAEYVDKMNYLCKINNQNGFEFDRALLNLNAIRNRFLDEDILELHGLQRKLATDVLKKTVCEVQSEFFQMTFLLLKAERKENFFDFWHRQQPLRMWRGRD